MFDIDFNSPIIDWSNFESSDLVSALGFGGAMVLIGMVAIFGVLLLLWGFLFLFKVFFHDIPAKRAKAAVVTPVSQVEEAAETTSSDTEIVAVIAAAIAMAEAEASGTKFQVVSFKRK